MKPLRILALMHPHLVPPDDVTGVDTATADWRMEYDVTQALRKMGHDVQPLGVEDDPGIIRKTVDEYKPRIVFNMLESFHRVGVFDKNVVSLLELMRLPYTGCNPRGMMLSRDKALCKTLLQAHRIPITDFMVVRVGQKPRRPKRLGYPLIVKSLTEESSIGISRASVVTDDAHLAERVKFVHKSVGSDALVEPFIEGREVYVAVLGNQRLDVFTPWELRWDKMPEDGRLIMTDRAKWNKSYQEKYGVQTGPADLPPAELERLRHLSKRAYRALEMSGYARFDFRIDATGRAYVLEANPNPQLALGEDFADSAAHAGIKYDRLLQKILNCGLNWRPEEAG